MFVIAAMAVTLIEATAFATDSAFAGGKKKYEKNQVISQAIECDNYWIPINIICYNLNSQAQGDQNDAGFAAATAECKSTDSSKNYGIAFP